MSLIQIVQHYEPEGMWLVSVHEGPTCEILVAGNACGPEPHRFAMLECFAPKLGEIDRQAQDYLDTFLDRSRFANGEAWHLDSIELGRDATSPVFEIVLRYTVGGYVYGDWTVVLHGVGSRTVAMAFTRQEL